MTTPTSNRWRFGVFTTDHRSLAILYLLLALAAVILGTLLSLAMRIHRIKNLLARRFRRGENDAQ